MSRVLFIVPPYYCFRGILLQPPIATLGALYLAAFAKQHGHDAQVLIADLDRDIAPKFHMSMADFTEKWKDYGRYVRGEAEHPVWGRIASTVRDVAPDVVAVSANTPVIDSAARVIGLVKSTRPDVPVVLGGCHGTFLPEQALQTGADYVIRGEGEIPLIALLRSIEDPTVPLSTVPSLTYKDGDGLATHTALGKAVGELDSLPFPARDSVILPKGMDVGAHSILTTRGCPHTCAFCSDRAFWKRIRRRSVQNVLDEIEQVISEFPGTKELYFHDGSLTCHRPYMMRLCEGIIDRGFGLRLAGTARFDELDRELLTKMKQAGFWSLYLGAESGDPDVLRSMNKRITPEQIEDGLKLLHEIGLGSMVSILVGTPDETEGSLKATINLMQRIHPTSFDVNSFLPLPGSQFFQELPEDIRKQVNYVDFAYKTPEPFMFLVRGQQHLLKYVQEIYAIADSRLGS